MYVSCSCLCCTKARFPGLEATFAKIKELGFAAFDLDVFENWQHVTPSQLADDADFASTLALRERLAELGVRV